MTLSQPHYFKPRNVARAQCNENAVRYYSAPYEVASRIKHYIAFWKDVETVGANPGEPEILPPQQQGTDHSMSRHVH